MDINKETPVQLAEQERTYIYSDCDVTIKDVVELVVRESGTHRLKDAEGNLWVMAKGWKAIKIKTATGQWTV